MSTQTPVTDAGLPSSRKLLRSTAVAVGVAMALLVTIVLPAEYGIDPTGIGRPLGLTEMGEIKAQLAREAASEEALDSAGSERTATTPVVPAAPQHPGLAQPLTGAPAATQAAVGRTDQVTVTLQPNEGKEIKLAMVEGARVKYRWATDRGVVNYDTHADRTAAPAIKYHGYAKGQGKPSDEGTLVAAFDGMHGWFWRNRTREVVTVTLRTTGEYSQLKQLE